METALCHDQLAICELASHEHLARQPSLAAKAQAKEASPADLAFEVGHFLGAGEAKGNLCISPALMDCIADQMKTLARMGLASLCLIIVSLVSLAQRHSRLRLASRRPDAARAGEEWCNEGRSALNWLQCGKDEHCATQDGVAAPAVQAASVEHLAGVYREFELPAAYSERSSACEASLVEMLTLAPGYAGGGGRARPYSQPLAAWFQSTKAVSTCDVVSEADSIVLQGWRQIMLNPESVAAELRDALGIARPCVGPELRFQPKSCAQFLKQLEARDMIARRAASPQSSHSIGLFFGEKSIRMPRLAFDTRLANCSFAAPPATELPTPSARASVDCDDSFVLAQGDTQCAFYHLRLPARMESLFALPAIPNRTVGLKYISGAPIGINDFVQPLVTVVTSWWGWALHYCQSALVIALSDVGFESSDMIVDGGSPRPLVDHNDAICAGHCAWGVILRRDVLAIFNSVYRFTNVVGAQPAPLWGSVVRELRAAVALIPLWSASTRSRWSSRIYASDASLCGKGARIKAVFGFDDWKIIKSSRHSRSGCDILQYEAEALGFSAHHASRGVVKAARARAVHPGPSSLSRGGLSVLGASAASASAGRNCRARAQKFLSWRLWTARDFWGSAQLDAVLVVHFAHLFLGGYDCATGCAALAALKHHVPALLVGSRPLPRASRAFQGWAKLAPPQMRLPLPRVATFARLAFDAYLRPSEACRLTAASLSAPRFGSKEGYQHWATLVNDAASGGPGKTGRACGSPEQVRRAFKAALAMPQLDGEQTSLCSLRRGGTSDDLLSGRRTRKEVKDRGHWRTDQSLNRYAKRARMQQRLGQLAPALVELGGRVQANFLQLMGEKARAGIFSPQLPPPLPASAPPVVRAAPVLTDHGGGASRMDREPAAAQRPSAGQGATPRARHPPGRATGSAYPPAEPLPEQRVTLEELSAILKLRPSDGNLRTLFGHLAGEDGRVGFDHFVRRALPGRSPAEQRLRGRVAAAFRERAAEVPPGAARGQGEGGAARQEPRVLETPEEAWELLRGRRVLHVKGFGSGLGDLPEEQRGVQRQQDEAAAAAIARFRPDYLVVDGDPWGAGFQRYISAYAERQAGAGLAVPELVWVKDVRGSAPSPEERRRKLGRAGEWAAQGLRVVVSWLPEAAVSQSADLLFGAGCWEKLQGQRHDFRGAVRLTEAPEPERPEWLRALAGTAPGRGLRAAIEGVEGRAEGRYFERCSLENAAKGHAVYRHLRGEGREPAAQGAVGFGGGESVLLEFATLYL
ncbi:unnamed protein product, partial [Prorocentrum cordatum]